MNECSFAEMCQKPICKVLGDEQPAALPRSLLCQFGEDHGPRMRNTISCSCNHINHASAGELTSPVHGGPSSAMFYMPCGNIILTEAMQSYEFTASTARDVRERGDLVGEGLLA